MTDRQYRPEMQTEKKKPAGTGFDLVLQQEREKLNNGAEIHSKGGTRTELYKAF